MLHEFLLKNEFPIFYKQLLGVLRLNPELRPRSKIENDSMAIVSGSQAGA